MVRLASMTVGGCAILAVGALALSEGDPEVRGQAPLRQSVAPAYPESIDLRLRLAQEYGTVCKTPEGSVCTIPPKPLHSRCECGGSDGTVSR